MTTVDVTRTSRTATMERVAYDQLREPGVYVDASTGAMYRVPEEALSSGRSPTIEIVCNHGTLLTKLADDPWIPISQARRLAADADLTIDF